MDRWLSAWAVMQQEAWLLAWAGLNVAAAPTVGADSEAQAVAASDVAGDRRLVLVVGPAGTGKTTMLASAVASLRSRVELWSA